MADSNQHGITHWNPKSPAQLPKNPLPGYKFKVYLQGVQMGFSKITNLERVADTEPLVEGGVNDYVHSLRKPVSSERTMTFERGVIGAGDLNVLSTLATVNFKVGQRIPLDMVLTIAGRDNKIGKIFFIQGAFVRKWSCSTLDAMSGNVLVETFEITYEKLAEQSVVAMAASLIGM